MKTFNRGKDHGRADEVVGPMGGGRSGDSVCSMTAPQVLGLLAAVVVLAPFALALRVAGAVATRVCRVGVAA